MKQKYRITNFLILLLTSPLLVGADQSTLSEQNEIQTTPVVTETVMFTPPIGWRQADGKALPQHVNIMVVGGGQHQFPPSITLATEEYSGTLKQYLSRIKEINKSKGYEWKDLGTIRTEAGNASLSQVDTKSEWGDVRMMHVILLRDHTMYIMTAAALKEEFGTYYKDVFNSFRSLRFSKNPYNTTAYVPSK